MARSPYYMESGPSSFPPMRLRPKQPGAMSSPRLNHVAKQAQRQLMKARQQAFGQTLGRTIRCASCGVDFTLSTGAYRGVAIRDRVEVEAVRFACPQCGAEQAVGVGDTDAR